MRADQYELLLADAGLPPERTRALRQAARYSDRKLLEAREVLASVRAEQAPGMATFALGSLGRLEASPSSDLDLAFLFDSRITTRLHAEAVRRRCIEMLREGFDIPEKTFRRPIDVGELSENVGGRRDTNDKLTYRALLLTEGVWLHNQEIATAMKRSIFDVYAHGRVTRGRFLNSLANDLHRYYRTVCVDYRHKVEEQAKSWSIRSLKLKHTRKLWHLANMSLQLWAAHAVERDDVVDDELNARLDWPSLARVTVMLEHFGALDQIVPLAEALDRFLGRLAEPEVRSELDELTYEERHTSDTYVDLRQNARRLDEACEGVVDVLWTHCREQLVRFWLL